MSGEEVVVKRMVEQCQRAMWRVESQVTGSREEADLP